MDKVKSRSHLRQGSRSSRTEPTNADHVKQAGWGAGKGRGHEVVVMGGEEGKREDEGIAECNLLLPRAQIPGVTCRITPSAL